MEWRFRSASITEPHRFLSVVSADSIQDRCQALALLLRRSVVGRDTSKQIYKIFMFIFMSVCLNIKVQSTLQIVGKLLW